MVMWFYFGSGSGGGGGDGGGDVGVVCGASSNLKGEIAVLSTLISSSSDIVFCAICLWFISLFIH